MLIQHKIKQRSPFSQFLPHSAVIARLKSAGGRGLQIPNDNMPASRAESLSHG